MGALDYVALGLQAVFLGEPAFTLVGIPVSVTVLMVLAGFVGGIVVGATPGLSGPFAMAVALPVLISVFGVTPDALLPVLGFLVGVMKGATVGGAVPAILFNTPGTPDALLTTFDGYPMTKAGRAGTALRAAHLSSASGDTFSDLVLFTTAPFLAVLVEAHLGFTEKAALVIVSMSFIAAVVGKSVTKGLLSALLGLLLASVATGEDIYPRLTFGSAALSEGFPLVSAVVGVLVLGEVFKAMDDLYRERRARGAVTSAHAIAPGRGNSLSLREVRAMAPFVALSAAIGTAIGALPGIGSTLAATVGYSTARAVSRRPERFGTGIVEGVAATEAANSAVSGANLIPALSLGIPGNVAAVFLLLAAESIGGFNPGPSVFRFTEPANPELVVAFGLFTAMLLANLFNWTIGGVFMRACGVLARIPRTRLLPVVLLLTLTSIYVEQTAMSAVYIALGFGALGYLMRRLDVSVLPFVIAFILAGNLEDGIRRAFAASGGDPWFFARSPIAIGLLALVVPILVLSARRGPSRGAPAT